MTPQDWEKVEGLWESPHSTICLECDGYKLSLQPGISKMQLNRMVYVDGWFRGEWLRGDSEECKRFLRVRESFVFPKKYRDEMLKIYGKRRYNKNKEDLEKKIKSYWPWWISFSSFKRHLIANNIDIKLITG